MLKNSLIIFLSIVFAVTCQTYSQNHRYIVNSAAKKRILHVLACVCLIILLTSILYANYNTTQTQDCNIHTISTTITQAAKPDAQTIQVNKSPQAQSPVSPKLAPSVTTRIKTPEQSNAKIKRLTDSVIADNATLGRLQNEKLNSVPAFVELTDAERNLVHHLRASLKVYNTRPTAKALETQIRESYNTFTAQHNNIQDAPHKYMKCDIPDDSALQDLTKRNNEVKHAKTLCNGQLRPVSDKVTQMSRPGAHKTAKLENYETIQTKLKNRVQDLQQFIKYIELELKICKARREIALLKNEL